MIKVDLITGFLGAGKTTFLLKYARYLMGKGERIGILEYDYGAINVDMLLLGQLRGEKCELEMLAAACDEDCLKRRFKTKLIAMAMSGYDRVIIEPSGVFDMDLFFDSLRDEPLENWYEIGSVITVVNGNLRHDLSPEEDFLLASQASCAGVILLSRTQLSTNEEIGSTKCHIKEATEKIHCNKFRENYFEKNWDELTGDDFERISSSGYVISDYVKTIAGKKVSFSTVCFLQIPDNLLLVKEKAEKLLNDTSFGNVLRIKGFVRDNGISYQLNATKYEFVTEPAVIGQSVLIVIGTDLNEEGIKTTFEE